MTAQPQMAPSSCSQPKVCRPGRPVAWQDRLTCFRMMSVACMMHLGSRPWLRARMAACSRETLRVLLQGGARGMAGETGTSCPPREASETAHAGTATIRPSPTTARQALGLMSSSPQESPCLRAENCPPPPLPDDGWTHSLPQGSLLQEDPPPAHHTKPAFDCFTAPSDASVSSSDPSAFAL